MLLDEELTPMQQNNKTTRQNKQINRRTGDNDAALATQLSLVFIRESEKERRKVRKCERRERARRERERERETGGDTELSIGLRRPTVCSR